MKMYTLGPQCPRCQRHCSVSLVWLFRSIAFASFRLRCRMSTTQYKCYIHLAFAAINMTFTKHVRSLIIIIIGGWNTDFWNRNCAVGWCTYDDIFQDGRSFRYRLWRPSDHWLNGWPLEWCECLVFTCFAIMFKHNNRKAAPITIALFFRSFLFVQFLQLCILLCFFNSAKMDPETTLANERFRGFLN